MHSIEELVLRFQGIPSAVASRWSLLTLVPERIFLSRNHSGQFAVFVLGERESFGPLPKLEGVSHSDSVEAVPSGERLHALRLTSADSTFGNRIMAHVAYELHEEATRNTAISNEVLIQRVGWIMELLDGRGAVLTAERQLGLVGECVLMRKLLVAGRALQADARGIVERWVGPCGAKRDFAGNGVAIEVKTTRLDTRTHQIGSIAQLDPQADEDVFLCSMGAKMDASAPRKLPDFVHDMMAAVTRWPVPGEAEASALLLERLKSVGYLSEHEQFYRGLDGFMAFHLPPKLFREVELDRIRLSSFVAGQLPSMVLGVSYVLEVRAQELAAEEEQRVLQKLLGF